MWICAQERYGKTIVKPKKIKVLTGLFIVEASANTDITYLGSYPNKEQRDLVMNDLRRWLNNPFSRFFKRVYIMPESVE